MFNKKHNKLRNPFYKMDINEAMEKRDLKNVDYFKKLFIEQFRAHKEQEKLDELLVRSIQDGVSRRGWGQFPNGERELLEFQDAESNYHELYSLRAIISARDLMLKWIWENKEKSLFRRNCG